MYLTLTIAIYMVFGFMGAVIGSKKGSEVISQSIAKMQTSNLNSRKKILTLITRKTEKKSEFLRFLTQV